MGPLAPNLNLFTNPICIKCARARLRWKHVISWGLIVLTVTTFICMIIYLTMTERELSTDAEAAKALLVPIIIIQAVIMMFLGTGSVASGLARERDDRLLDYQRMTPMSPTAKILGYLFGLPMREYFLFALTLPFLAFAVIKSGFEISKLLELYVVFFSSVWLYHMTGMVAGMASSKPRFAAMLAQGMVFSLYFILPRLGMIGFRFFEHLTILPTFMRILFEETSNSSWQGDPGFDPARFSDVPFFEWMVSPTAFSLIVQGFILVFMYLIVRRKWKDQNSHPFSKSAAVVFFAGTMAFLIGNIWPIITRPETLRDFLERLGLESTSNAPATIFMIIFYTLLMVSGMCCLITINLITPSKHTAIKGWRLARKLGHSSILKNSDAASSLPATIAMIVLSTAACGVILGLASQTGEFFEEMPPLTAWIPIFLLNASVFLFVQALRERFSSRVFMVTAFLLWMVPVFVTLIMYAAWESWITGTYIGLLFPPLSQALTTYHFFEQAVVVNGDIEKLPVIAREIPTMVWVGTMLYTALAGILQYELWRWKREIKSLHHPSVEEIRSDVNAIDEEVPQLEVS